MPKVTIRPAKYAGKCAVCKARITVGQDIAYDGRTRCMACYQGDNVRQDVRQEASRTAEKGGKVTPATKGAIDGKLLRRWNSWGEYVDAAAATPETNRGMGDGNYERNFYGYETLQEAVEHARHGWSEPRKEVDVLVGKISDKVAPVTKPAFTSYFDVSGGTVDIGRFLDGEPECMVETRMVEIAQSGRVVGILINGCYSAGIKDKDIRVRGAAVVGLIDALEKAQYSTEVWLEISHKTISYLVKLKGASDALDIDTLMFAIGNKGCFRHLNFSLQDLEDVSLRVGKGNSYGYVSKLSCAELVGAQICLEAMRYGSEEASAEVWIKNRLSDFGLLIEEGE